MPNTSLRLVQAAAVAACLVACSKEKAATPDTTASTNATAMKAAPSDSAAASATPQTARGTVERITDSTLAIKTADGDVTINIERPLQVYARTTGSLKDVNDNSFVGVTSVPSPDGSQKATEIHIFPDQLRGLGEGSRPMTPQPGAPSSAQSSNMTNGTVSHSQMVAGTPGGSRMTNGTVASNGAGNSTITVSYNGGSQTITVPANVTVTKIAPTGQKLMAGMSVTALTKKNADGSMTTNTVMLSPAKR